MQTPTIKFEVGQKFANIEIVEIIGTILSQQEYRIRYQCCGEIYIVGRKALMTRRNVKSRSGGQCRSCSQKKLREEAKKHETEINQIFIPGWGMTLGKMGRLWGQR